MNNLEEAIKALAAAAAVSGSSKKFDHLTEAQRVERHDRRTHALWDNVTIHEQEEGSEAAHFAALVRALRDLDCGGSLLRHNMIDEDTAPRKESKLRCAFWNDENDVTNSLLKYAEYVGYITADHEKIKAQRKAIDDEYLALKPADDAEA